MAVIEHMKSFKGLITIFVIVVIFLAANFPIIQNSLSKMTTQKSKKVSATTKTLNISEFIQLQNNQIKLSKKYDKSKTEWLHDEIHGGTRAMTDLKVFLSLHPEYDSIKVKFSVIKYKVNGKTVEFLTSALVT